MVTVEDGRAVRVAGNPDHPPTHGALCTKVSRYPERTYHPERVLTPLKRVGPKGAGQFQPIGWDEALVTITGRLQAIAARDPQAILPYSYAGTMGLVQGDGMAARLACCAKVQKCTLEVMGLLPQTRINRLCTNCSTCMPTLPP